jgi:nucleotide-binding universal stress UspA family protein
MPRALERSTRVYALETVHAMRGGARAAPVSGELHRKLCAVRWPASCTSGLPMMAIKHILVPTDFSEPAERALSMAVELAQAFKARVTLLHVWSIPNVGYAEALTWPIDDMQKAARKALEDVRARIAKVHADIDMLAEEGKDWRRILDVAKERNADLIVIGTHGRRGLPRLVLGSVAEKVVRLSPVPVLTVGMPEEAPPSGTKK